MFALKSTVRRAEAAAFVSEVRYQALLSEFNKLVHKINAKGGMEFLDRGVLPHQNPPQFSPEEIKNLLQLCHPDKHDGKPLAVQMTQRLLEMRK